MKKAVNAPECTVPPRQTMCVQLKGKGMHCIEASNSILFVLPCISKPFASYFALHAQHVPCADHYCAFAMCCTFILFLFV